MTTQGIEPGTPRETRRGAASTRRGWWTETTTQADLSTTARSSPESAAEQGGRRVVIVGGGFAGLGAARGLRRLDVDVTLVDARNFHLFQPLLYQVATGALSAADIASPLRSTLGGDPRTEVLLAEAVDIEPEARRLVLADGARVAYDYLVLAPGSVTSYFGHDEWSDVAPGLKTVEDARDIRRRILLAFESAERATNPAVRAHLLTFVVVGGGPTGVELAGAIGEIAGDVLRHRFRHIDPSAARIVLVEMGDRILPAFPRRLAERAVRDLRRLGVEVRTGTTVTAIDEDGVRVRHRDEEDEIAARTVVWAAGVRGSPLIAAVARSLGLEMDRAGRLGVEPDLSIPGHPEILVLGDAAVRIGAGARSWPGVAPVAMQQGAHAARVVRARLAGTPAPPFRYHDRGDLATIGTGTAVARIGGLRFSGFPAWILWVFVHIAYLVEFQHRVLVLTQWAWAFFTRGRSSLLITQESARGADPTRGGSRD